MKNIEQFKNFGKAKIENKNTLVEKTNAVNESNSQFKDDIYSLFYDINRLNFLMDEGYLNDNGSANNIKDANDALESEFEDRDFFDITDEHSVDSWVTDILNRMKDITKKYL